KAARDTSAEMLTLDRLLERYGPETAPLREALKRTVASRIELIWPKDPTSSNRPDPMRRGAANPGEQLADGIRTLAPHDDTQRALQARAIEIAESLLETRWLVFAGNGSSVPTVFLVVLVFWLTITFASFGMLGPTRNATVVVVLLVCALSVGSAA